MQVACSQCGASYEFDAAAIPEAGYDAQCTTCGNVFFVAPDAPPHHDGEPVVSVSCSGCGAVYQFAPSAIPAGGYDAQCTQCHAVFFVAAAPSAVAAPRAKLPDFAASMTPPAGPKAVMPAPAPESSRVGESQSASGGVFLQGTEDASAEPTEELDATDMLEVSAAEPEALVADPPTGQANEANETGGGAGVELAVAVSARANRPLVPPADGDDLAPSPDSQGAGAADLMALGASLGDPDSAAADPANDFEAMRRKRRLRLQVGLGAAGLLLLACVGSYFLAPRFFDATLGRLVGIKRTVDPAAVALMDQARAPLLDDTDSGYAQALTALSGALQIDPGYPEAVAYAALAYTLRGSDEQRRASELAVRGSPAASELLGKAESDLAAARDLLEPARQRFGGSAVLAAAAGILESVDPSRAAEASAALRQALDLAIAPGAALDLAKPPELWVTYLQARLWLASAAERAQGQKALVAALALQPRFARARFDLAIELARSGSRDEAQTTLRELLAAVPLHAGAKQLLVTLEAASAPSAAVTSPVPSKPVPPAKATKNKRKGKKKRGG